MNPQPKLERIEGIQILATLPAHLGEAVGGIEQQADGSIKISCEHGECLYTIDELFSDQKQK